MNIEEKENIRLKIKENIEALKKDVLTFKKLSKPVSPDNAIGRITRMEAINSKSINEAAYVKSKTNLKDLQKALEMISDPEFGYCKNCEEPIPYKRLLIMPQTPFCVLCAEEINGE